MKGTIFLYLCAILLCACGGQTHHSDGDNNEGGNHVTQDEVEAVAFLTDFYNLYISGSMEGSPLVAYKEYLSEDLLRAFEYFDKHSEETGYIVLDCDPFIKAQDVVGSLRDGNLS